MRNSAARAFAALAMLTAPAAAQQMPSLNVTIDYAVGSEAATAEAERFFNAVQAIAEGGRLVNLTLTIIPAKVTDGDLSTLGYSLTADPEAGEGAQQVACGEDLQGVVDNYESGYELTFNHPENYHSPTTIQIGDRREFPFQELICSTTMTAEEPFTQVRVSGVYVITTAPIPTATAIHLFPYNR